MSVSSPSELLPKPPLHVPAPNEPAAKIRALRSTKTRRFVRFSDTTWLPPALVKPLDMRLVAIEVRTALGSNDLKEEYLTHY